MVDITARQRADYEACEVPGDYFLTPADEAGVRRLSFLCPCGCGMLAGIRVRTDGQHVGGAWGWNLDESKPTATPSIDINRGHWHGYLTDGIWKSC